MFPARLAGDNPLFDGSALPASRSRQSPRIRWWDNGFCSAVCGVEVPPTVSSQNFGYQVLQRVSRAFEMVWQRADQAPPADIAKISLPACPEIVKTERKLKAVHG